ncbi:MAG: hypothetical protein JXP34_17215 [Planctomycetes bacterium]|nr:hypothetical protein [Planctomycetota bacterium]
MTDSFILQGRALPPSAYLDVLRNGGDGIDRYLAESIYVVRDPAYLRRQRERFARTVALHRERFGDSPMVLVRAPGRLNALLEYLDMCAGDHMSTTIDGDIPVAVTVRDDDEVRAHNIDPQFPGFSFSIREELRTLLGAPWTGEKVRGLEDNWDNRTRVYPYFRRRKGDWGNYVRAAYLRFAYEHRDVPLRGAHLTFGPSTIPLRAGTSSSSAVVVLSFLSLWWANQDRLDPRSIREICKLLGEAEWYVGTHGGANDHTTILRNRANCVLYNLHHLPLLDSQHLPGLEGVRIIVANTLWESNKALGANHVFNLRKGWMDLGDHLLIRIIRVLRERAAAGPCESGWIPACVGRAFPFRPEGEFRHLERHPEYWERIAKRYHRFGSLDETLLDIPDAAIDELVRLLPEEISPEDAGRVLEKDREALARDYTLPDPDEEGYRPRGAARFFHNQNRIGREVDRRLREADRRVRAGEWAPGSAEYREEKVWLGKEMEALQATARDDFRVSNGQLDLLLSIARRGPGYLGGKLTGAGSGGCVCILVEEGAEDGMMAWLDREYYGHPEHFLEYRSTLDALEAKGREVLAGAASEEEAEEARAMVQAATDMRRNLDAALADVRSCRRAVTFSSGAGLIALDGAES